MILNQHTLNELSELEVLKIVLNEVSEIVIPNCKVVKRGDYFLAVIPEEFSPLIIPIKITEIVLISDFLNTPIRKTRKRKNHNLVSYDPKSYSNTYIIHLPKLLNNVWECHWKNKKPLIVVLKMDKNI